MQLERLTAVHWDWLIWVEMFLEGVAAGLFLAAAILALNGRDRSPAARTAHLLALPIMLVVTVLLIVDLGRPERFWHMLIMNERLLPILKPWSPMSLGSWLVGIFSFITFVSFVDALIDVRNIRRFGRWRRGGTLHGSPIGVLWTLLGAFFGMTVAIYAGVLLAATNIPGWAQAPMIPAVYAAAAAATGVAAIVLVHALRDRVDADVLSLAQVNKWFIAWWLVVSVVFLILLALSVDGAWRYFLESGWPSVALVAALIVGCVLPLFMQPRARQTSGLALAAMLVLLGGLLMRVGIVMGPQEWLP